MKKVCLISTLEHNVGDDFARAGIVSLLREIYGPFEERVLHKHFPLAVRGQTWAQLDLLTRDLPNYLSWRRRLAGLIDLLPVNPRADMILDSDLIVQCGAPVYWINEFSKCSEAEWLAMVTRRWRLCEPMPPFMNLAAGACQPWGSDGSEIVADQDCRQFITEFTRDTVLTTTRDPLAHAIVLACGHDVPLLPCTSIFAPALAGISPRQGEFVALNFMHGGGHYDFAGGNAAAKWQEAFCAEARRLAAAEPCLMVCHNKDEHAVAARLLPEIPRFLSRNWRDYLDVYSRCTLAVVNRVHGAVVAAAMGKRVFLTGNDSRLLTASMVPGIGVFSLEEASSMLRPWLWSGDAANHQTCAPEFVAQTRSRYLELLGTALLGQV